MAESPKNVKNRQRDSGWNSLVVGRRRLSQVGRRISIGLQFVLVYSTGEFEWR